MENARAGALANCDATHWTEENSDLSATGSCRLPSVALGDGEAMPAAHERREYPNPPIEEALVQVTFAEPLSWNVATPGLLFERLRGDYPTEPEMQEQAAVQVQADAGGGPALSFNRGQQRFLYRDESRTRLVLVNPLTLSANSLRPYEGWPKLRERFERAMSDVEAVTGSKPVARIALRYINRITLPPGPIDTDDYFKVTVRTADEGRAAFRGFIHRVESVLDDETVVVSTFASTEPEDDCTSFVLDLEFSSPNLNSSEMEQVLNVADELKVLENAEFESCITDATRELFG
jgi:uncharacterized protein (TIGR04255 family)